MPRARAAERADDLPAVLRGMAAQLQTLADAFGEPGAAADSEAMDAEQQARIAAQAERVLRRARQHTQRLPRGGKGATHDPQK